MSAIGARSTPGGILGSLPAPRRQAAPRTEDAVVTSPEHLLVERRGTAVVLTLNRPDRRNALGAALVADLAEAVVAADADAEVRAIVIAATGETFCPGLDLHELRDELAATPLGEGEERVWGLGLAGDALLDTVYRCSTPTIAAVRGAAAGNGAGLLSVCDIVVCGRAARVGYPEVRSGVQLTQIVLHLVRLVGERLARRLLLGGEMLSADQALAVGLVTEVVDGDPLGGALAWAQRISANSPQALAATKRALHAATDPGALLADPGLAPHLTADAVAGLSAFFDRTDPPWVRS